jgi:hypothetical protein
MRALGDSYVKQEFALHKKAQPKHVERFMREWTNYLEQFRQVEVPAADLDPNVVAAMTDDQQKQLDRLKEEAVKATAAKKI